MKKRPLIIGEQERKKIKKLLQFSKQRSNWFHPKNSDFIPSESSNHVLIIPKGYKCVFTYTEGDEDDVYKHLTVATAGRGNYPNENALFSLAGEFGFRKPKEVGILVDTKNERVILIEKVNKKDL